MIGSVVVPRNPSAKYQSSVAGSVGLTKNIPTQLGCDLLNTPKNLNTMDTTGNDEMDSNSQTFDCAQRPNFDQITIAPNSQTLDCGQRPDFDVITMDSFPISPPSSANDKTGNIVQLNYNNSDRTNNVSDHQTEPGPANITVSCPQCQHVFVPKEPINRKFVFIYLIKFY